MEQPPKITARIIIEILGTPKEHVETTMKQVIIKMKNEEHVKLLKETTYETEQIKEFFSTFSELEIEVKNIEKLIGIIFDYMPSSLEILEPKNLVIDTTEIAGVLNDLIAKLHRYDSLVRDLHAENMLLKKAINKERSFIKPEEEVHTSEEKPKKTKKK